MIEIFNQADEKAFEYIRENDHMDFIPTKDEIAGVYADHLLANGVIVPPCKVGDTVYYFSHRPFNLSVKANTIYEAKAIRIVTTSLGTQIVIQIRNEYGCTEVPDVRDFGKTVFLTREEAEAALKGR